jgi:hypothetical protein
MAVNNINVPRHLIRIIQNDCEGLLPGCNLGLLTVTL